TPYTVASDPAIAAADGMRLFEAGRDVVRLGGGDTIMLGGGIANASDGMGFLLDALPSFMCISKSSPSAAAVVKALDMLEAELGQSRTFGHSPKRTKADTP